MSTTPPYHYSYQTIDDPEQVMPYQILVKSFARKFQFSLACSFITIIGASIIRLTTNYIDTVSMWYIIIIFGGSIAVSLQYLEKFTPALQATTIQVETRVLDRIEPNQARAKPYQPKFWFTIQTKVLPYQAVFDDGKILPIDDFAKIDLPSGTTVRVIRMGTKKQVVAIEPLQE